MKTYCIKPFSHIWYGIDDAGNKTIRPCCMFPIKQSYANIDAYLQSEELQQLQQHMLTQDTFPASCRCCAWDENLGLPSMRLKHLEGKTIQLTTKIVDLEIFPSNACNLKCISCKPEISTGVAQEWHAMGWIDHVPSVDQVDAAMAEMQKLPDLATVSLIGGEFFVTKRNLEVLDYVIQRKFRLQVITNGTVITSAHLDKLRQIDDLDITVSTDGIGDVFEFLRYPASWTEVAHNIKQLKDNLPNAKLHLNSMHHPLTCQHLQPLFEFANSMMLPITVITIHRPLWLSWLILTKDECNSMSQYLRQTYNSARLTKNQQQIVENTFNLLATWDRHDTAQRQEFVSKMAQFVKHRGVSKSTLFAVFGALTDLADEVWHHLSDSNARPLVS